MGLDNGATVVVLLYGCYGFGGVGHVARYAAHRIRRCDYQGQYANHLGGLLFKFDPARSVSTPYCGVIHPGGSLLERTRFPLRARRVALLAGLCECRAD